MGDKGLEQTGFSPEYNAIATSECAVLCADDEIPLFVIAAGRVAEWADLSPALRQAIAHLHPDLVAALASLLRD